MNFYFAKSVAKSRDVIFLDGEMSRNFWRNVATELKVATSRCRRRQFRETMFENVFATSRNVAKIMAKCREIFSGFAKLVAKYREIFLVSRRDCEMSLSFF